MLWSPSGRQRFYSRSRMTSIEVVYCGEETAFERLKRHEEGRELELGFERLVKDMKEKGNSDAEIATKLVEKWNMYNDTSIPFLAERKSAAYLPEDSNYLKQEYWSEKLESEVYTEDFWKAKHQEANFSNSIPKDDFDLFILYFLCDWVRGRFYSYIVDKNVPEEERLVVLQRQVENFVFFSRTKLFGSRWKLNSEPDFLLQKALLSNSASSGDESSGDESSGDESCVSSETLISGGCLTVEANKSIPKDAGDGPKLDALDHSIYKKVQSYATTNLGETAVHRSWTMVRGSFIHPLKKTDVRCCAFSGHANSNRELDHMPGKWWSKIDWVRKEEVHIADVDSSQFGHNMVLVLFHVLMPLMKGDLLKLAHHVAFDEKKSAEDLILVNVRHDMNVLHYGYFYDFVVNLMNSYDKHIKKLITKGISKLVNNAKTLVEMREIWECISVGGSNKKFEPNRTELENHLSERFGFERGSKISGIMEKISQNILSKLKKEIEESPNKYLEKLLLQLKQTHCAEDNAIGPVLHKLLLLNSDDAFLNIEVIFISMDANCVDKVVKPFCGVCAHKVWFYSVLPVLLRAIGSTGKDFDQLAPLFAKLKGNLESCDSQS